MELFYQTYVEHERPPAYESEPAPPSYHPSLHARRAIKYSVKQQDRSHQQLIFTQCSVPSTPSLSSFTITTKRSSRLFGKRKPDIQFSLEIPKPGSTHQSEAGTGKAFFDTGPATFPWFPTAKVQILKADGSVLHEQQMQSKDFLDWEVLIDGSKHYWCYKNVPYELILKDSQGRTEVARWIYSENGMEASHGQHVGELSIYEDTDGDSGSVRETRDLLIAVSCWVVAVFWWQMGRNYKNEKAVIDGLATASGV